MQWRLLLSLLLLWAIVGYVVGKNVALADNVNDGNSAAMARKQATIEDVIEWFCDEKLHGGFMSDLIDVVKEESDDEAKGGGTTSSLVAVEEIDEYRVLLEIPASAVLVPEEEEREPDEEDDEEEDDDDDDYEASACGTAIMLDYENDDKEDSNYFPYTSYLMETLRGAMEDKASDENMPLPPYAWSDYGQQLIREMIGGELEPQNFGIAGSFAEECLLGNRQKFEQAPLEDQKIIQYALFLVHTQGWNNKMVPMLDLIGQDRTLANVRIVAQKDAEDDDKNNKHLKEDKKKKKKKKAPSSYLVVALRDIAKGERLYRTPTLSTSSEVFLYHGTVESYPQRWSFDTGYKAMLDPPATGQTQTEDGLPTFPEKQLAFDLFPLQRDEDSNFPESRLRVQWLTGDRKKPSLRQVNWLVGHYRRLHALEPNITAEAALHLSSDPREKDQALSYYKALKRAIDHAVHWATRGSDEYDYDDHRQLAASQEETCDASNSSVSDSAATSSSTSSTNLLVSRRYDNLQQRLDHTHYNHFKLSDNCYVDKFDTPHRELTETAYQRMKWSYFRSVYALQEDKEDNMAYETCLHLETILHSCMSFFPHVHETIIHYPASYVDEIKRVLYVGGGDLIILNEILKYPSLELVIGLELDQAVLRSSFRHYGLQPHFDNEKVNWWFGDASKSLAMLPPEEYHGTFDLVIIDLIAFVFDTLRVGDDMLVDYMMKFVKPEGVLVRQEDYPLRHVVDFAKYTVELAVQDLPYNCIQSFTMGSQMIDFSKKAQIEHPINTIYYGPLLKNKTSIWGNVYVNHKPHSRNPRQSSKESKQQVVDTSSSSSSEAKPPAVAARPRYGILSVIEAEKATYPLHDMAIFRTNITRALSEVGLSLITTIEYPSLKGNEYSLVVLLKEGYVVARSWPDFQYCGFDLQLWNSIQAQKSGISSLVSAVGGSLEGSTSSFTILTGGMYGNVQLDNVLETTATDVQKSLAAEAAEATSSPSESTIPTAPLKEQDLDVVLTELLGLIQNPDPVLVVLCGAPSVPCPGLDRVQKNHRFHHVIPLWSCASLAANPTATAAAAGQSLNLTSLMDCERYMKHTLLQRLSVAGHRKINGIWIDSTTPIEMGMIVHKICNDSAVHFVADDFFMLAPYTGGDMEEAEAWKEALLERFRTEIVLFNPVYHAHVIFHKDTTTKKNQFNVQVLSAGDIEFYDNLRNIFARVQEKTQLTSEIRRSKIGVMTHVPDYFPTLVVSKRDYISKDAYKQWNSQAPIAHQTILQYEFTTPLRPIPIGSKVLINDREHPFDGQWLRGRVVDIHFGNYRVALDVPNVEEKYVSRHLLLEFKDKEEEVESPLYFGDLILIKWNDPGNKTVWYQGSIVGMNPDGTYKVQTFDGEGDVVLAAERRDLVLRMDPQQPPEEEEGPKPFSSTDLKSIMQTVLDDLIPTQSRSSDSTMAESRVGDGYIVAALYSRGGIVASWDGQKRIDVNVFGDNTGAKETDEVAEKLVHAKFTELIPGLSRVQYDAFPRGFGRVVNPRYELKSMWFGQYDR